ncbi:MAG: hypothetical protein A3J40_05980 [Erythrobacter sp. RIFCSPHIGHO2_12_FULL_63_10]|nr:MAG: hypothetical protein A3J40_05980 [Erythrobacter sp. RIFCSPHIGHO2_12_FULL_63_10]
MQSGQFQAVQIQRMVLNSFGEETIMQRQLLQRETTKPPASKQPMVADRLDTYEPAQPRPRVDLCPHLAAFFSGPWAGNDKT